MTRLWCGVFLWLMAPMLAAAAQPLVMSSVMGTVRDESGSPVPGIQVRLRAQDGKVTDVDTTDAQGQFHLRALPGKYHVKGTRESTELFFRFVVLSEKETKNLDVVVDLRPGLGSAGPSDPRPAPLPLPPAPPLPSTETHALVPVYYATDRERGDRVMVAYGTARNADETLYLGRFDVSIPRDAHAVGHIERPNIWSFWRQDPARHFVIRQRVQHTYEGFYRDLAAFLSRLTVKQAFVFVHGYNVLFEDAVYRTAQLAYDLGFDGVPILYSWPSIGTEIGYPVDLNNADWTAPHLRWFLEDVAKRSGADVVHVIAHSMGNRPVMAALNRIAAESTRDVRSRFRQIVLTAPDIDASTFRGLAGALPRVGQRVTLYASSNDVALKLSQRYQGYPRAGDTVPRVVVVRGVDTIDVSALDTGLLGHSYFGDNRSVISDLFYLIHTGLEPSRRANLRVRGQPPDRYWVFLR